MIFSPIRNQIFKRANIGIWNAKNIQDHIALKNNWNKNKFLVCGKVLYADTDIRKYKIGQTIPNTNPGGLREDLLRVWYQTSLPVSADDIPPKTSARNTKKKIEALLLINNSYLFLKKRVKVFVKSFKKVEPFGLASIKI